MADPAEVLKSALSLNLDDRAAVAEELLASLDDLTEEDANRLWAQDALRRREEIRTGRAGTVESREVAKKAKKLFR